uniref:Nuclear transport factor 2 (Ntf2) domain-containing protein n=1 Tax=Toxoplasma gondii COUG TaxID=1074873 RepID=A0A2G8Y673_TOXGO|nr:nuclear transport factor 2 (ntf2) domain-containing protein [Toxoplasma gondii COUG]
MSVYSVHPSGAPASSGGGFHHSAQNTAFSGHHGYGGNSGLHPSSSARGAGYGQPHHLQQQQMQLHLQQPPLPPPPHHQQYQGFTNAGNYSQQHNQSAQQLPQQGHPHSYAQPNAMSGASTLGSSSTFMFPSQGGAGGAPAGSSGPSAPLMMDGQGSGPLGAQVTSVAQQGPEAEHAVHAAAKPRMLTPMEVAHSFVYQYYYMLHDTPLDLHRFYDFDSQMIRTTDRDGTVPHSAPHHTDVRATGQREIYRAFERGRFERTTCRVRFIDAQENKDGGMLILVAGRLKHADEGPEREFAQTVFLAKQKAPRNGWYVTNEIFCYLDAAVEEVENGAREAVVPSSPSPRSRATAQDAPFQQGESSPTTVEAPATTSLVPEQSSPRGSVGGDSVRAPNAPATPISPRVGSDACASPTVKPAAAEAPELEEKKETVEEPQRNATPEKQNAAPQKPAPKRQWKREDAPNVDASTPDANWPRPGETKQQPKVDVQQQAEQFKYDPKSFAFKVVQNAQRTTGGPKGFAVPASRSTGSSANNGRAGSAQEESRASASRVGTPAASGAASWGAQGAGEGAEGPTRGDGPPAGAKKLVVLSEMPAEFSVDELKKAVAEQLKKFNEGQAVEIRKPASGRTFGWFIELDCRQSAEYLMQQGLYVRGRQMRLDFARQQGSGGPRGGGRGGRGGRGGWNGKAPNGRGEYSGPKGEGAFEDEGRFRPRFGRGEGENGVFAPAAEKEGETGADGGQWIDAGKKKKGPGGPAPGAQAGAAAGAGQERRFGLGTRGGVGRPRGGGPRRGGDQANWSR